MGIHDTLAAVILPLLDGHSGSSLMKQFSENIPTELLESAKIDVVVESYGLSGALPSNCRRDLQPLPSLPHQHLERPLYAIGNAGPLVKILTISLGVATMQAA